MGTLVTITTDFGTADAYVAEMKGVLLSEGPADMRLVDLSHDLVPFQVHQAALFLRTALANFPSGAVHLVVVDPEVGSSRRAIVAEVGGSFLVGPDNAVLGYLFDGTERVFEIDVAKLDRGEVSSTFHGRDVFAPVAARLAAGARPEDIGTPIDRYQHLVFPMVEFKGDSLLGKVIHIDHFGNLVTNIPHAQLRAFLGDADPVSLRVHIAERTVEGLCDHYAERDVGELLSVIGSSALLEVAAREGDASVKLGAVVGTPVRLSR